MFDYFRLASIGLVALATASVVSVARAEFEDGDVAKYTLGAGVAYDDNVFRQPSNPPPTPLSRGTSRSDTIFTLNAGAAINKDVSRQNFELGGNVIQRFYTDNTDLDATLFNFGATWNWRIGNQFSGEIGYTQNQYSNAFLEVTSFTPNKRTVGIPVASIGYQFHPNWEARAKYQFVDITNSAETFKLSDLEQHVYEGGVRYRTQFGNLVDLYYRYTDGNRPNVIIDPLIPNTSKFEQHDIGINAGWQFTGRSRFSGFLAYTDRSYQFFPARDFSGRRGT